MLRALLLSVLSLGLAAFSVSADQRPATAEETPPIDGYRQLMPRGGIPALFEPVFVSAGEAEIPADAWVLGYVHDGQAYAYDLNLLNKHEVVNHGPSGAEFAAVW